MAVSDFESDQDALGYLRRETKGVRVRSDEDIKLLLDAVAHGSAVARSAHVAFALMDTAAPLLALQAGASEPRRLPGDDPVLGALADLGRVTFDYINAWRALIPQAPSLMASADALNTFMSTNSFWSNSKPTLVSEAQMMCLSVIRTVRSRNIRQVSPKEMEALVVAAGVRLPEEELAAGKAQESWKKLMAKARKFDGVVATIVGST
jgi:hypothetical protein